MQIRTVIVTFNSIKTITECLDSVIKQPNNRILVVDNGSTDGTKELVKNNYPVIEMINSQKNSGFAGGNNAGINKVLRYKCDYVLILNPDTKLFPNTINNLVSFAKTKSNQGIFGPKIVQPDGKIWSAGGSLDNKRYSAKLIKFGKSYRSQPEKSCICEFISGTCMLIKAELIKKGLRFYEPYFLYYEDVEFCLKAQKLGFPSYFVDEAEVIHYETSAGNNLKNYYLARNHLLFVERNAPIGVKLHELIRLPKTVFEHYINGDKYALDGVRDYLLRRFGKKT